MTVWKLILKLAKMPMRAEVRHVWDGEPRTSVNHVWLSVSGEVMTADDGQAVYTPKHRPKLAGQDRSKTWYTPGNDGW